MSGFLTGAVAFGCGSFLLCKALANAIRVFVSCVMFHVSQSLDSVDIKSAVFLAAFFLKRGS